MLKEDDQARTPAIEPLVHCPRLERPRTVAQHCRCVYCFGGEQDIRGGNRATFCDFQAGRDPIVFGFPEEFNHFSRG